MQHMKPWQTALAVVFGLSVVGSSPSARALETHVHDVAPQRLGAPQPDHVHKRGLLVQVNASKHALRVTGKNASEQQMDPVKISYRLGDSIEQVEHQKKKGAGYRKGSPLFRRQQKIEDGELEPGGDGIHGQSCMWLCLVLLISCGSLSVAGGTSQLGGRDYQGGKQGIRMAAALGTLSVVLTVGVVSYIAFFTNILRTFLGGHEVGLWCAILCVWALVQVVATLIMLTCLACFLTAGAVTISSYHAQQMRHSSPPS